MVIWTIQAKRQLRHGLAEKLCETAHKADVADCLAPMAEKMAHLDQMLEDTFPGNENIIVLNELTGYRRKDDIHILLVEVSAAEPEEGAPRDRFDGTGPGGPFVVKIGPAARLNTEIHGWNCCRPVGLRHDLVLLPLHEAAERNDAEGETWLSLVYGDAQQFIGVERTVSLEEAFLDAVRFGKPSVASITTTIVELFERLGHLLYATSFTERASDEAYAFRMPKLVQALERWNSRVFTQSIRTDMNVLIRQGAGYFVDPVSYFEDWVLPHVDYEAFGDDNQPTRKSRQISIDASGFPLGKDTTGEVEWLCPSYPDLIPNMRRGCAHGDLHGRNILVGLVHDRALWPTVFDYEDMDLCNLIGWDFVKLETELKVRAYWQILPRAEKEYFAAMQEFERDLNTRTERHHHDSSWPLVHESEDDEPVDRLRAALLEIRRMASLHLGKNRGRANQWLEEYYFLLAAYGMTCANFGNLDRRELSAAYLSAGVATSRLWWPRRRLAAEAEHFSL